MRTAFKNLFEYNFHTNQKILKVILENPSAPADCIKLMSHIINAQQVWLGRLAPEYPATVGIWDIYATEDLENKLVADNENWTNYLKTAMEEDILKIIPYKNSKGDPFQNRVMDILYHVINHGTHHRGQISLLLRQTGIAPPVTDYIAYMREAH